MTEVAESEVAESEEAAESKPAQVEPPDSCGLAPVAGKSEHHTQRPAASAYKESGHATGPFDTGFDRSSGEHTG